MIPAGVAAAAAAHERAAKDLIAAAQAAYPVGTRVSVRLGRATVIGPVTGHSEHWWSDPGTVSFRNEVTGKLRSFYAASESSGVIVLRDGE